MTRESISTLLMVTAIILPLASWKNFRKPGVPFWRFAPLHSVHKFLHPVGTGLYWGGLVNIIIIILLYSNQAKR